MMRCSRFRLLVLSTILLAAHVSTGVCWACYAVIVGWAASADGSVLVGHNEENGGERVLRFYKVPRRQHPPGERVRLRAGGELDQVPETWAFLWSENPGLTYSDGYVGITDTPDEYEPPVEMDRLLSLEHHFQPPAGASPPDLRLAWWKLPSPIGEAGRARQAVRP